MVKRQSCSLKRKRKSCASGTCGRRKRRGRMASRSGEDLRNTVGEYRQQARELMPIYELLEDSVAVEKLLKDRIEEFNYIKDKTSQLDYDKVVAFVSTNNGSIAGNDVRLGLIDKIGAFYVKMKKVAKDVSKEIKKEYTSSVASHYTLEYIMMIFRKAAAGMTSYKGRGKWGSNPKHKCPDALLSAKEAAVRKAFKKAGGVKVGTSAATAIVSKLKAAGAATSKARQWKNCLSPLEALVLVRGSNFHVNKKWGVQLDKTAGKMTNVDKLASSFSSDKISSNKSSSSKFEDTNSAWYK